MNIASIITSLSLLYAATGLASAQEAAPQGEPQQMWRKVRDVTGDESWIHKPALSGVRRVLVLEDAALHSKAKSNVKQY